MISLRYYEVLVHLAGQVPDDLLDIAHQRLSEEDIAEVGRLLKFAAMAYGCTVPPACATAVHELLVAGGASEEYAASLVFPREPVPPYRFHAVHPAGPRPSSVSGALIDLVAGHERLMASPLCDAADTAIASALSRLDGVVGVWRSWRSPSGGASWPPLVRVVLVSTGAAVDPITARTAALAAVRAVDTNAVIEVLAANTRVPGYHRKSLTGSALLWARGDRRAPTLAPVFDQNHEKMLDGDECTRMLTFLASGVELMTTPSRLDDVIDHTRRGAVPITLRTDGVWIWSDATSYYLLRHQVAPFGPLLDHARTRGFEVGPVDEVAVYQALAVVLSPKRDL